MRINVKALLPFIITVLFLVIFILSTVTQIASHIKLGLDLKGGFEILYQVKPVDSKEKVTKELLLATERMIEKRINISKVAEPDITIEGSDRIRVKLAGVKDQTKLRELINQPAYLTFKDEQGRIVLDGQELSPNGASIGYDQLNHPEIIVKFKDPAKLKDVTAENLGKPLSIMLDDKEISAPIVRSIISDGTSAISSENLDSATEMKDLLNAGSLPAQLIEKQVNSVSASLGGEALHRTLFAGYAALALIILFMLITYRLSGLIANLTILGFVYICFLLLDWMNATLTLSGIAGFILAIGMAVDANIITYEKIKEELMDGKSIRSACRNAAKSSFPTIVDAHVTTLIAALVLMLIGTNAVKGFAIVLMMTIIVSLFTNVFGSRFLLWLLLKNNVFQKASWWFGIKSGQREINNFKRRPNIVKRRNRYLVFSTLILILGLTVILIRGLNLGVDFQSGTRLDVYVGAKFENSDLTRIIQEEIPSVKMKPVVKYGENGTSATTTFSRPIPIHQLNAVENKLKEQYGDQVSKQESTVDPMIANEMVKKAGYAILIASVGIVLYTSIRFHYLYGIACIIALFHDILLPIALFSVFRLEIDLTFIAAILTIVGYSLNDTIVIFDRIRTNLRKTTIKSVSDLEELVNLSLWQTMRRSIYTVLTVFISAVGLLWLGGEGIHLFSLALIFGLVSGAYSSIFIAAQTWLMLYKRKFQYEKAQ
ncbi:protein translocase subunit SecDF [Paenibacillus baekrokdamisoli]|uniref:Multifunctional fusion protein n=1 Tax=Paenibacillus baekrokdamisoli TaxID=1712516 RepID=A0A3G9JN90_9BACL|nr:protein translocase subunit SecD [Paenibacillus baekrokdamisoli]MBB3073159.1 SecD/SecF fusion protein [Paenibacillus baekrokdamisoli]BBH24334.1 protein translocase subunit SecDF [Paenibacillus baekrokdamisoli]